jgi:hypothetical protein
MVQCSDEVALMQMRFLGGTMAIFESLTNTLKALAIGERVKVTLRPEIGRFPNPMEGHITQKDESGNFSLKSEHGVVQVSASGYPRHYETTAVGPHEIE